MPREFSSTLKYTCEANLGGAEEDCARALDMANSLPITPQYENDRLRMELNRLLAEGVIEQIAPGTYRPIRTFD